MGLSPETRSALEWVRADFDTLLDRVTPAELRRRTHSTRSTNLRAQLKLVSPE